MDWEGIPKTPTALLYDEDYEKVASWENLALKEEPDEVSDKASSLSL